MNTNTKIIGSLLIGITLGAATGLLLAPRSGKKTRKKIKAESKRMADELIENANESLANAKRNYNKKLEEYVKTGKASINNLSDRITTQ